MTQITPDMVNQYNLLEAYLKVLNNPEHKRYAIAYWRWTLGAAQYPKHNCHNSIEAHAIREEINSWSKP